MADISQITLPDGTTYDIKDPVARAAAGDAGAGKIFYGVSSTAAATQTKVVTIEDFELFTGALIAVKFDNVNTATAPKLNISGTGAINMYSVGTTAVLPNAWSAGETLLFVYNGTSYMVADGGIASTSGYGATKLNSSTSSTSTTEAATPSAVKSAYDLALEAKTSASDGKSLIASAITGKGVSTSATDTFSTMASNIDSIQTGHTIMIDGEEYDGDVQLLLSSGHMETTSFSIPHGFDSSYQIVQSNYCYYNGESYCVGSDPNSSSKNYFKKFNGSDWTSLTNVPSNVAGGPCVAYDNKIHVAKVTSSKIYHYAWNGSSWALLESVAYPISTASSFSVNDLFVYNNSLYMNCYVYSDSATNSSYYRAFLYNANAKSWVDAGIEFPTTQQAMSNSDYHSTIVYNGDMCVLFAGNYGRYIYRYDGSSWTKIDNCISPGLTGRGYSGGPGCAIVYNGYLYTFGRGGYYPVLSTLNSFESYGVGNRAWDGSNTTYIVQLPLPALPYGCIAFFYNDCLYIACGGKTTSSSAYFGVVKYTENYVIAQ